jgi:hypothetical protein
MTTTPTVWKAEVTANAGIATGEQFDPVTIGLANGRMLTAWVDDTNNVDVNPFSDIVGRIYDAQGNPLGGAFKLNQGHVLDHEINPAIAALPDGGYVIAYLASDPQGIPADIRFDRFDAAGMHIAGNAITDGFGASALHSQPSIAVLANGDFVVSYVWNDVLNAQNRDIFANVVNGGTNIVGAPFNASENSFDADRNPDTVVLSSDNILTVEEESDGGVAGIQGTIRTAAGASAYNFVVAAAGTDPHAAALASGRFAVVWADPAENGNVRAEIRNDAGVVVTPDFLVSGA